MKLDNLARRVACAALSASLAFNSGPSWAAEDTFLSGVQVYSNRLIDWAYDIGLTREEGVNRAGRITKLSNEAGFDIKRGGSQLSEMSYQLRQDGRMWGMEALLPILKTNNMKLNLVIVGTHKDDIDPSAPLTRNGPDTAIPPKSERVREVVRHVVALAQQYGVEVHLEVGNEPDLYNASTGFCYWRSNLARYKEFVNDVSVAAHAVDPNAKIVNGGLVLGEVDREGYLAYAIEALKAGQLWALNIHHHGSLEQLSEAWNRTKGWTPEIVALKSKVILNETGSSAGTEHENAVNVAGKLLFAKAMGFKGAYIFHMGGLPAKAMQDLWEGDPNGRGDFSLVDVNLNPKEGYYALKAANTIVKGLPPVKILSDGQDRDASGKGRWAFLFDDGSRKVLVGIRQRPTDAEIKEAFGSASYAEYGMDGSAATPGSNGGGIVYLVSGFVPEEETPDEPDPTPGPGGDTPVTPEPPSEPDSTPALGGDTPVTPETPDKPASTPPPGGDTPSTPTTPNGDPSNEDGSSSGGCDAGWGMICLTALAAMFLGRRQ